MPCYFFSGKRFIKVTRDETGPGEVLLGYPNPISFWKWGSFGENGIDAALYSGSKDYFFAGKQFIRVTRGDNGSGTVDPGYPKPISDWGWGSFGANGIDAALYSGSKTYFFSGRQFIRVTRGDVGAGTMDAGYPKPITDWGWGSFGANGIDAALNSGPVDYFFSGNEYIRVTRGDTGAGTIDAGYPAPISRWGWGTFGADGIDAALFSGTDVIPGNAVSAPDSGLGSNSNYILYSDCEALADVTVTINVTDAIVAKSSSGSTKGFGFQLNAYSPPYQKSAWQQYIIALFGNQLIGAVNNYPVSGKYLILDSFNLHELDSNKIPAGYQLKIGLQTGHDENVVGAVYTVIDNHGHVLANKTLSLIEISGVTTADLAPIVAFELNLVGPVASESSVLSSGSGRIVYQAANALSVLNKEPDCTESGYTTAEKANSVYGKLNFGPSLGFSQTFGITSEAAMISKKGKARPGVVIPVPEK